MSFTYGYYFRSLESIQDIVDRFEESLSVKLNPTESDQAVYVGRVLAMELCLMHSDDEAPLNLKDYQYCLEAKVWSPESDLLFIQPSLFFSVIYMMYRRLDIKKGFWAGDSLQTIAEYDQVNRDSALAWYDLTHGCAVGCDDEHVEDYLLRIFPRSNPRQSDVGGRAS